MKVQGYTKRKCITIFISFIMALNFSIGQEPIEDSLDYFSIAYKAHMAGDDVKALKFYNKHLEIFPNDAPTYNNLGNIFVNRGDIEKGMQDYLTALSIDSSMQLVRYNIGIIKFDQGLFGESVKYYKQEIKVNPTYSDAYNNLGYAYYMLEEFDLAIDSYRKALVLDTNNSIYKENLKDAQNQKVINEKWKEKLAKYKMIIYDSSFNQLKELGFPSAYNIDFVASPHYIYPNWDTYSGVIVKLYKKNNNRVTYLGTTIDFQLTHG